MKISFEQDRIKVHREKSFCPYLKQPSDDCYCVKMSSQDIERAIYFCTKNFKACEIFIRINFKKPAQHITFISEKEKRSTGRA
jgi:hypothetical protein